MAERRTVIVVGGGIGGLSAAIALRCAGWDAQVFERAPGGPYSIVMGPQTVTVTDSGIVSGP
jgi:2-polyprenyl-6-methoxyphenol hydroxylase-like FAD-dependent oxidoreductase